MKNTLKQDQERLFDLIVNQNKSYEEIGRMYGCSGNYIKRIAKELGIPLKQRRNINSSETFNRKLNHKCQHCGKQLTDKQYRVKYCSKECLQKAHLQQIIDRFNSGQNISITNSIPDSIKNYLLEQQNYKCSKCGFEGYNSKTGNTILQVHHIDGNSKNNTKDNIEIICPNCHAMTETFMALNAGNATRVKYKTKN